MFAKNGIRPLVFAALIAAAWPCAAGAQPGARKPETDQTVAVTRGAQLFVNNFAGEVVVHAWDRDQVRVVGRHASRVKVNVRQMDNAVRVSSGSSSGTTSVDYDISIPAWMPVRVTGQFNYVEIEGVQADVSAETVRGDIRVKGASGIISLKSIEGAVYAEDARGRITASSVNEGVTLVRVGGEVHAETINGEITITESKANSAEGTTVNGDVHYTGTIADSGLYRFTTHQGDILMGVPEKLNATVSVRAYQGDFRSSFAVNAGEVRRGRRQTFTFGAGNAQIELESFGGDIRLRRTSEIPPVRDKAKDKKDVKEDPQDGALDRDATDLAGTGVRHPPTL